MRLKTEEFSVSMMCRALAVTRSKYYDWVRNGCKSQKEEKDAQLVEWIKELHEQWLGVFGYRRMVEALEDAHDIDIGETHVRRLMREQGLFGVPNKKRRRRPKVEDDDVPDLLRRDFTADHPNRVWVTDLTEIKTAEGKLYLCIIKDVYDGVVVAYGLGDRQTAALVVETVDKAVQSRLECEKPILHSDHGSQYTSHAYRECMEKHGMKISMGRVKTCADNASAEAVFGQLKRELVHRCRMSTKEEAKKAIDKYFLNFFNPWRRKRMEKEDLQRIAELAEKQYLL